jgi:hypothetical protein
MCLTENSTRLCLGSIVQILSEPKLAFVSVEDDGTVEASEVMRPLLSRTYLFPASALYAHRVFSPWFVLVG